MPRIYLPRAIAVEAERFLTRDLDQAMRISAWCNGTINWHLDDPDESCIWLRGVRRAVLQGDYIVKRDNRFERWQEDDFRAEYEEVTNDD